MCKGGGKVERRRREYRGAEGAEVWGGGFPYLLGERSGEEQCILSTIFAVQLPIVQTRNTAFGLTKLAAAACMQCTAQRQQKAANQACWKVETFYKQPL